MVGTSYDYNSDIAALSTDPSGAFSAELVAPSESNTNAVIGPRSKGFTINQSLLYDATFQAALMREFGDICLQDLVLHHALPLFNQDSAAVVVDAKVRPYENSTAINVYMGADIAPLIRAFYHEVHARTAKQIDALKDATCANEGAKNEFCLTPAERVLYEYVQQRSPDYLFMTRKKDLSRIKYKAARQQLGLASDADDTAGVRKVSATREQAEHAAHMMHDYFSMRGFCVDRVELYDQPGHVSYKFKLLYDTPKGPLAVAFQSMALRSMFLDLRTHPHYERTQHEKTDTAMRNLGINPLQFFRHVYHSIRSNT